MDEFFASVLPVRPGLTWDEDGISIPYATLLPELPVDTFTLPPESPVDTFTLSASSTSESHDSGYGTSREQRPDDEQIATSFQDPYLRSLVMAALKPPTSTARTQRKRKFRCRHDSCNSPPFPKAATRDSHELSYHGSVCTGKRSRPRRRMSDDQATTAKTPSNPSVCSADSHRGVAEDSPPALPFTWEGYTKEFDDEWAELLVELRENPTSERRAAASDPLELDLKTSLSVARKRDMINKVMEAFDEVFSGSPVSGYSNGFGGFDDQDDTEYSSDSDSSPLSQAATDETNTTPFSCYKDHVQHDSEKQEEPGERGTGASTRAASGTNPSNAAKASQSKRKINNSSSPGDDEAERDGNAKKRQRAPGPGHSSQFAGGRKLACPYTKRYPNRAPNVSSCLVPGFPNTARLK